ncbi:MAG TPA: lysophospholipid acyltransferase family protein [Pseudonocardiaceae bacterium]|nr:lysophospholipid acyltransferase family protein [Pseudonocardiaceae bacterium]
MNRPGTLRRMAMVTRIPRRGRGFWYGVAIDILYPIVMAFTVPSWRGGDHIPETGPVLLASNHLSFVDPVTEAAFVLAHGRIPRFMAKSGLWDLPVIGKVLADGGHIPVHRDVRDARGAYVAALAALERGEVLMVYPESTFTDDPDGWPMRGKTGVAKMALESGVPVVPIAHWGSQRVLPPKKILPRLLPRKRVSVHVGKPVDLSEFEGQRLSRTVLTEATERIMAAITDLLTEIRDTHP